MLKIFFMSLYKVRITYFLVPRHRMAWVPNFRWFLSWAQDKARLKMSGISIGVRRLRNVVHPIKESRRHLCICWYRNQSNMTFIKYDNRVFYFSFFQTDTIKDLFVITMIQRGIEKRPCRRIKSENAINIYITRSWFIGLKDLRL